MLARQTGGVDRYFNGLLVLFSASLSAADRIPSQGSVAFAINRSGESWAYISAKPFTLEVRRQGWNRRTNLGELDAVAEVSPSPSIEWSQDGRYILITYRSEEGSSSAEVYDARSLKRVLFQPVSAARWLKAGAEVVAVPASGELGEHSLRGLLIFNVKTGMKRRIADRHVFVGGLDAGEKFVIAQLLNEDVRGLAQFVRVNTSSGALE
jgi:hypothetical protein